MKKFLALALAATAMVWAQGLQGNVEIIGNGGLAWWAGEPWGTTDVTISDDNERIPLKVTVTGNGQGIAAQIEPGGFSGLQSMSVTYSSTAALRLVFRTPEADGEGGSTFRILLPKKPSQGTENISLSQITRPNWVEVTPGSEKNFSNVLQDVNAVFIMTLSDDDLEFVNGDFTISSILLNYGAGGNGGGGTDPGNGGGNGGGDDDGDDGDDDEGMELVNEELGYEWHAEGEYLDNNPVADYNGTYVEATFELQAEDEDNEIYPNGSLGYYDDYNYVGLDSIVVEYEADQKIAITLMHYDDLTYYEEAFLKVLNKTNGSKTKVTVLPSQLAVDTWSEFKGALNLEKVKGVSFAAVEYEKSTTIKLYSVKLYGVVNLDDDDDDDDDTSIKNSKTASLKKATNIAITGISAGKIGLNVPTTGNYSIAIYSVDGRMLAQTKANLVQGVNSLTLGKNLAKGIAIVRVQGANAALVKKISIK